MSMFNITTTELLNITITELIVLLQNYFNYNNLLYKNIHN